MPFNTATATNYQTLVNAIVDMAKGRSVTTAVIAAGGTGYSVGDILTATGGTFSLAATFEVLTLSGSAVATVKILNAGVYTTPPGNPVSTTVVPAGGTGATLTLTFNTDNGWTVRRDAPSEVTTPVTVNAGGSGYVVGDDIELDVAGGIAVTKATFNVDSETAGAVTAVSILTAGNYTNEPTTVPTPTTFLTGSGTGCTLTPTFQRIASTQREVILEGEGAGSDTIFVGIRTFTTGGAFNWELAGMTGFTAANSFATQPGISPGRNDLTEDGCYVPLNNSTLTYWFNITGNRLIMIAKSGSSYPNMYLGFPNRFATAVQYPFPLIVGGCSSIPGKLVGDTSIGYSGMTDPIPDDTTDLRGPMQIRLADGTWATVKNSDPSGGSRSASQDLVIHPAGSPQIVGGLSADKLSLGIFAWTNQFIPFVGVPGSPVSTLKQTPETGDDLSILVPTVIVEYTPTINVLGELDNVFWVSAAAEAATIVSEDDIDVAGVTYRVFQNCNRTELFSFFAMKEA